MILILLLRATGALKPGETVKIKISGDGAQMTRLTSFVLFSFGKLQDKDNIMFPVGNFRISLKQASKFSVLLLE